MLLDAHQNRNSDELGEDTWELFELIEDSFGVELGGYNELLGKSVEEIAELIAKRSTFSTANRCLSQIVFYLFRNGFHSAFGATKDRIRPGTGLITLFPWSTRRAHWSLLQQQTQLDLPSLAMPGWLLLVSFVLTAIGVVLFWAWIRSFVPLDNALFLVLMMTVALWIGLVRAVAPLGRTFPRGCKTVADLVRFGLGRNYSKLAARYGGAEAEEITVLLIQLIAVQVCVKPETITSLTLIPQGLNIY